MKMALPILKDVPKPDAWLVLKKSKKKTFIEKIIVAYKQF